MLRIVTEKYKVDFCVVGGGLAGVCAALSAARHGIKTALVQDRPVLGGNASSEMRVNISGADIHNKKKNQRETGILEELRLENLKRNPSKNCYIFDTILYEKVKNEKNISLFLNTSCLDAKVSGKKIKSVKCRQLTTEKYIEIEAKIFADCSGDAVLAPLSGAKYRVGREARSEFNEAIAVSKANRQTMGMTCCFQAEDTGKPVTFVPPVWVYTYKTCKELPNNELEHCYLNMGYWWIEMGGDMDSIRDTEKIKDELLKVVYGVWDHIKNYCKWKEKAKNWDLTWVQFLPAKRESRRYIGDFILTANDISDGKVFEDTVAYGGWPMDDHNSGGFMSKEYKKKPTIFHKVPMLYTVPYRILYSKNIENLMFAGRCVSVTHMALSSTRVMATCSIMGQAVGTAVSIAVKKNISPRQIGIKYIKELQQKLLADDCYLPGFKLDDSKLMKGLKIGSSSKSCPSVLMDGVNRPVGEITHKFELANTGWVKLELKEMARVRELTIIFDSMLEKNIQMNRFTMIDNQLTSPPLRLVKAFTIKADAKTIFKTNNNFQRLVKIPVNRKAETITIKINGTWGEKKTAIFGIIIK